MFEAAYSGFPLTITAFRPAQIQSVWEGLGVA